MTLLLWVQTLAAVPFTIDWKWVAGLAGSGFLGAVALMFRRILQQLDTVITKQDAMGLSNTERAVAVETVRVTLERRDTEEQRWRGDFARMHAEWMVRTADTFNELKRRMESVEGRARKPR